ncbi:MULTISPECIES: hypothetical protein [Pseudomonas syringae group genomosp. 2]|uniref:hypothetical protein n=1 Tax=Pseudomonas syringae group genomosp. 2 TaxID=251698 RepID=UPI000F00ACD4|nr:MULTISPECIES: hypothetical protein [Pseudomonas syringae group genomosp. 2]QOI04612.1 hypothetical protein D5S10_12445 [Pseudomonas savastanoi]
MEARRESLRALAVALADRADAVMSQAVQQGQDVTAALAKDREHLAEVSSDFSEDEATIFRELYAEEMERRAESSRQYLSDLDEKRAAAKEQWMVNGKVSREKIREYVKRDSDVLVSAAARGENVHQMALDQMDAFHEHLILIPHEHSDNFNRIYLEELDANSHFLQSEATRIVNDADALNQKTAEKIAKAEEKGKVLGFIILAVIVVAFLVAVKH